MIDRLLDRAASAIIAVLGLAFIGAVCLNFANVVGRYAFGKAIFGLIVWLELVMISFTAPALTSGAIALERERQTFDLLKVTLLNKSLKGADKIYIDDVSLVLSGSTVRSTALPFPTR